MRYRCDILLRTQYSQTSTVSTQLARQHSQSGQCLALLCNTYLALASHLGATQRANDMWRGNKYICSHSFRARPGQLMTMKHPHHTTQRAIRIRLSPLQAFEGDTMPIPSTHPGLWWRMTFPSQLLMIHVIPCMKTGQIPMQSFFKNKEFADQNPSPDRWDQEPNQKKNAKLVEVCSFAPFPAPRTPALDADEANNPFCFCECEYFVENTSEEEEYKLWRRS